MKHSLRAVPLLFFILAFPFCAFALEEYDVSTSDEFIAAVAAINASSESMHAIYLTDDIDLVVTDTGANANDVSSVSFLKNTTTIYGEGHTLTLHHPANGGGSPIPVLNSAILNLGAADYEKTLTVTETTEGDSIKTTGLFAVLDTATLNMYDNVTVGPAVARGQPGGISLTGSAQFNMYGGRIYDCDNTHSVSGAVYLEQSSTFTMYDGVIEDCDGTLGGAVGISGQYSSFIMKGGLIQNCTENWYGGAAVCMLGSNASFIMENGTIKNCSTGTPAGSYGYGGAICSYSMGAEVEIIEGEITGNYANRYGGGLFVYAGSVGIGSKARIHNNTADGVGDDIFNYACADFTLDAPAPTSKKLLSTNRSIDGWYIDGASAEGDSARWSVTAPAFTKRFTPSNGILPGGTALKAAHALKPLSVPDTGDGTHLTILFALALFSLAGFVFGVRYKKS